MAVRIEKKGDSAVCYVDGEIDINTAPDIKKALDKLMLKKEPRIVINLTRVTYVDSSGLATLVEILKNMRTYGGKMKISNMSAKIRSLFEITKLEKLFDISVSEEEAIASFAQ